MEAAWVTGPAKNLIEFAQQVRQPWCGYPPVDLSFITFQRGSPDAPNAFVAACRKVGIAVDVIPERRALDLEILPRLRSVVAGRAPDILQSHGVKSHFLIRWTGLCRDLPWIAFHHGYTMTDLKMRLMNQLNRWSLPAARHVVTVCRPFAAELERHGVAASRITVRHNAVRPFIPSTAEEVERLRSSLGIPAGASVIVTVGRLSREKGHRDLVDAVARIRALEPSIDFRVVIVGDGPERAALERQKQELGLNGLVLLAGQQRDVRPYYSLANVFALPSHTEGSPNALLEAMAAGVPAAVTAVGGVPEIAEDGRNALVIEGRNPAGLAAAILRLLQDSGLARRLAAAGKETAARFTPDLSHRTILEVYRRVLERSDSPLSICASR